MRLDKGGGGRKKKKGKNIDCCLPASIQGIVEAYKTKLPMCEVCC